MTKLGMAQTAVRKELERLNDLLDEVDKMESQLKKLKQSLITLSALLEKRWVKLSNYSKNSGKSI